MMLNYINKFFLGRHHFNIVSMTGLVIFLSIFTGTIKPVLTKELPKPEQVNTMHQWEYFLRRTVNFLYRCNAVKSVKLQDGRATHSWEISLYPGNDPRWLKQHREELKEQIRRGWEQDKFYGRVAIAITAPKFDVL